MQVPLLLPEVYKAIVVVAEPVAENAVIGVVVATPMFP